MAQDGMMDMQDTHLLQQQAENEQAKTHDDNAQEQTHAIAPTAGAAMLSSSKMNSVARQALVQNVGQNFGNSAVQRMLNKVQRAAGLAEDGKAASKSATHAGGPLEGDIAGRIQSERGNGQPMDSGIRREVETSLGADLSRVRVHTGPAAAELNNAVGAKAFTTGRDIFFGEGHSATDKELVTHEATHTVQQGFHENAPSAIGAADTGHEHEAEHNASHGAAAAPAGGVQREDKINDDELQNSRDASLQREEEDEAQAKRDPGLQREEEDEAQAARNQSIQREDKINDDEMQNARDASLQREEEDEAQAARNQSIQREDKVTGDEDELQHSRDASLQREEEDEAQAKRDPGLQREEEDEAQAVRNQPIQREDKFADDEMQQSRDGSIQREAQDEDVASKRDGSIQRQDQEDEVAGARDASLQREDKINDDEMQQARDGSLQREEEDEAQAKRDPGLQREDKVTGDEDELQHSRDAAIQRHEDGAHEKEAA